MLKRLCALFSSLALITSYYQPVFAQDFSINHLPMPGTMVTTSASFAPLTLKGIVVNLQKPLEFQFIIDTGYGSKDVTDIKEESKKLVKYFLAGLTIPEKDLWVNLSPYEKDRIIPEALGHTDLGRDLLAQDYFLKQLTASLIYPGKDLGKEFWARVYQRAKQEFGTTQIPFNTFNKVWILPSQAQVFENKNAVYITKSTLKVLLDEDYVATIKNNGQMSKALPLKPLATSISSKMLRQIIIPEIENEVNTGKNFAPLRQIYDALILAKWYKETVKNALLDVSYKDKNKIAGVHGEDLKVKEHIYNRYLQAYKKGVFNYIKEDVSISGPTTIRKYFSGGTYLGDYQLQRTGVIADVQSKGLLGIEKVDLTKTNKAMLTRSPQQKALASIAIFNLAEQIGFFKLEDHLWEPNDTSRLSNLIKIEKPLSDGELKKLYNDFTVKGFPVDEIQSIPFGEPKQTWSESWAFRLFLRKKEDALISPASQKIFIGYEDYYVELAPEPYDLKMDETETGLREQVKLGVLLNATNLGDSPSQRKNHFKEYFGQENAEHYFEAIEAVRMEYQKETGSSTIILDGRTAEESKRDFDKYKEELRLYDETVLEAPSTHPKKPMPKFRGDFLFFKEKLVQALVNKTKTRVPINTVINDLKNAADRLIDRCDFLVEYANRNVREGIWGLNTAVQILFLHQMRVGVVSQGIVQQIKNGSKYIRFPKGYEEAFQFNPGRANRTQTGERKSRETFLAWTFVKRVLPLERVIPFRGNYFYNILPNPFPHLRGSINIVRQERNLDHVPPQIADEKSIEDMLVLMSNFAPMKDQERFRIFLNGRFSGLSFDHLHFQGFLQKTKVEEALTRVNLEKVELPASVKGVEAFYPKSGAWWMKTTLVLEGADYKQMATAIGAVLRRTNDDGDIVVNANSKFTYNMLFTYEEQSQKYKVFIFIRNLKSKKPSDPDEILEPTEIINDPQTGLEIFNGRPATVEFSDTLIYGDARLEKAFQQVVSSSTLPGHILETLAQRSEYKKFDELLKDLRNGRSWSDMVKNIDPYDPAPRALISDYLAKNNLSFIILKPEWDVEHNFELLIALKRMGYEILGEAPWAMDLAKDQPQRFFSAQRAKPFASKLFRNMGSAKLNVIFLTRALNGAEQNPLINVAVMKREEQKKIRDQFGLYADDPQRMGFITPDPDAPDRENTVTHDLNLLWEFASENRNRAMSVDENLISQIPETLKGGIDLNQIKIKRDDKSLNVNFNPAMLHQLMLNGFEGFTPVITDFKFIVSPFPILGVNVSREEDELVKI